MTNSTPSAPVLQVRGLDVNFGSANVLSSVDLQVRPGQVVALLGANGAGKTTLMRTAAGLVSKSAGTIELDGRAIDKMKPHQRVKAGLCLIPEGRGVFPNLTVRENLRLQAPSAAAKEAMDKVITAFPILGTKLHQKAGSMSGGQQQMLALGRGMVNDPSIVLLDEVSMGLAPLVVDQIFEALENLAATGVALLLVEQYVSKALTMADHVYVLDRGTVVWSGPPADITEEEIMRHYLSVEVAST